MERTPQSLAEHPIFLTRAPTGDEGPAAPAGPGRVAGWAFVVGITIFSGGLYALALSGLRWFGAITPIGGVALLVGWGALAWAGWGGAAGQTAGSCRREDDS